ncbi:MAG: hypothetical protein KDB74_06150 [Flavobacteriales bacterium]|nr:hypothetical protein [Flavobacteriales bacterium]MCB9174698.1 hypothetical protein [Flavobacteriales bacterium]
MQTTHFIKYIADANAARQVSETEAASLVKEFPYCQSGQLLLAIHLNQNNHLLFEQQLKKSAIYSADRKRLFDLINAAVEVEQAQPAVTETPAIETKIILEQSEPIVEIKETVKESITTETTQQADEELNKKDKLLELEYINQAISNSYSLELEEGSEKTEDRRQKWEEGRQRTEDGSKEFEVEELDENATFTFSDWLKHLPTSAPQGTQEKTPRKNINLDLIDKFIQEDPKIKPKKTEFYSPINMARLSVVDDSDLVSETLALIQVEQGNLEAAIKTYQKLSLKNPEKRTYFANQIKILNQKIK